MWKRKKSFKKDKKNLSSTIPPDSPNSKEIGKEKFPVVIEEENEEFGTPRSQLDQVEIEGSTPKENVKSEKTSKRRSDIVDNEKTPKVRNDAAAANNKTSTVRNDVDNEKTPKVRNAAAANKETPTVRNDVDNEKSLKIRNETVDNEKALKVSNEVDKEKTTKVKNEVVDSEKPPKIRNDVDGNEKIPTVNNDIVNSEKAVKVSIDEGRSSNEKETYKVVPLANEDTNTDIDDLMVKTGVGENKRADVETKNEDSKVKSSENFRVLEDEQTVPISEVPKVIETTKEVPVDDNLNKLNKDFHKNSDGFNDAKEVKKTTSEAEKTEILGRNKVDGRSTVTRPATFCNCCGLLDVLTSSDR